MADIVSPSTRSRMMAGIRGKDTKPEMTVRHGLHSRGFRYILHDKRLPGKPDLVLPKYSAVLFVHGCFWHGHGCHLFKWPKTRIEFWREKIERNKKLDEAAIEALITSGWRTCIVWECVLKGRLRFPNDEVANSIALWLASSKPMMELAGITDEFP